MYLDTIFWDPYVLGQLLKKCFVVGHQLLDIFFSISKE